MEMTGIYAGDAPWSVRRSDVQRHLDLDGPDGFVSWPTVQETMYVGDGSCVRTELRALEADGWERWKHSLDPKYRPNSIHQAYHFLQWTCRTDRSIEDLNTIVEFGGGYGALAYVVSRLGFSGTYHIYDFPEFHALQSYYLSGNDLAFVPAVGPEELPEHADLIVDICALSEMAPDLRRTLLARTQADEYLFFYHATFYNVDNLQWMREFVAGKPDRNWHTWKVAHYPAAHYHVGVMTTPPRAPEKQRTYDT